MLGWLRRLLATNTPQPSAMETAFLAQSQALIDLARSQHETLDRIVAARYDRPFVPPVPKEANSTMPAFMLDDQAFSADILTTGSDREFLESVN